MPCRCGGDSSLFEAYHSNIEAAKNRSKRTPKPETNPKEAVVFFTTWSPSRPETNPSRIFGTHSSPECRILRKDLHQVKSRRDPVHLPLKVLTGHKTPRRVRRGKRRAQHLISWAAEHGIWRAPCCWCERDELTEAGLPESKPWNSNPESLLFQLAPCLTNIRKQEADQGNHCETIGSFFHFKSPTRSSLKAPPHTFMQSLGCSLVHAILSDC